MEETVYCDRCGCEIGSYDPECGRCYRTFCSYCFGSDPSICQDCIKEEMTYCDRCGREMDDYDAYNSKCERCYQTICSFCFGSEPSLCLDCERYGDD